MGGGGGVMGETVTTVNLLLCDRGGSLRGSLRDVVYLGGWGVPANEYSCAHGAHQLNLGYITSQLIYGRIVLCTHYCTIQALRKPAKPQKLYVQIRHNLYVSLILSGLQAKRLKEGEVNL
jgi:hypothetical protein